MVIIPGKKKLLIQRYYAGLLDYLLILIPSYIYIFLAGDTDWYGVTRVTGLKSLVIPMAWFLYFPVCEGVMGQTLGKKAFDLHVVGLDGKSIGIVQATGRRLLDFIDLVTFGVFALVLINISDKNQRLGDMIAGTTVVKTYSYCRNCGEQLELSPKEALLGIFMCPNCNQQNLPL